MTRRVADAILGVRAKSPVERKSAFICVNQRIKTFSVLLESVRFSS
jgi:hypothetical protein